MGLIEVSEALAKAERAVLDAKERLAEAEDEETEIIATLRRRREWLGQAEAKRDAVMAEMQNVMVGYAKLAALEPATPAGPEGPSGPDAVQIPDGFKFADHIHGPHPESQVEVYTHNPDTGTVSGPFSGQADEFHWFGNKMWDLGEVDQEPVYSYRIVSQPAPDAPDAVQMPEGLIAFADRVPEVGEVIAMWEVGEGFTPATEVGPNDGLDQPGWYTHYKTLMSAPPPATAPASEQDAAPLPEPQTDAGSAPDAAQGAGTTYPAPEPPGDFLYNGADLGQVARNAGELDSLTIQVGQTMFIAPGDVQPDPDLHLEHDGTGYWAGTVDGETL